MVGVVVIPSLLLSMSRPTCWGTLVPLALLPAIQEADAVEAPPPKIVLILADDLGIGDPTCYNPASKIPTPHIDRIASEGMRLTDAHSPSSVCSPTRYALLTGRYAWRGALARDVLWGDSPNLIELDRHTLPEVLATRGYTSAIVGKWHLGLGEPPKTDWSAPLRPGPLEHGFDEFFGIAGALDMSPYVYVDGDRPVAELDSELEGGDLRRFGGEGFWRPGPAAKGFRHERVLPDTTDRLIDFVERRTRDHPDEPFLAFFSLTAPHTPWVPNEEFQGKTGAGWYGDFVAEIDHEVGRVLDTLDRLEIADETLVVFTSDNGAHWTSEDIEEFGHLANLDYRGQKADIWEGGHRVPFLVRWPGRIAAGSVRDELFCLTDLFPTFVALAGGRMPEGAAEDGVDQTALWLGEELEAPPRDQIFHHAFDGMLAVRRGRWKLIAGLGSGGFTYPYRELPSPGEPPGQLYDLVEDRLETKNLWDEEPKVRDELLKLLLEELTRDE